MKLPQRPTRFIVIPRPSSPTVAPTSVQTMRLMHLGLRATPHAAAAKKAALAGVSRATHKAAPAAVRVASVKVVNRSPADGALLLEPLDHITLDRLKAQAPQGAKVLEEQWSSALTFVDPLVLTGT
jgi:hypothetical protein